jgi:hypothetical protein
MSKMHAFKLLFVLLLLFVVGCGKKEEKPVNKENPEILSLIKKDSLTGKEEVMMKYIVKKGDTFFYKMTARTATTENSPATEGKDVSQDNEINYFYTKEVQDVDASGIITYKVQYDSITINAQVEGKTIKYNSNINDTIKSNPAFIQYNAVIKEPFFIRVKNNGEITDIYGLEKIHENLFKALGDTLKEEEKQTIKDSFGKESIKEILQQEYQMFPDHPVDVDSSWVKSYNTQLLFFDAVNSARYTLKSIEDKDDQKIINIDAVQNVEFLNKEVKQRGVKFVIENAETSGTGKIAFNLNRGCITSKETTTKLDLDMRLSAQGQSAKSVQKVQTNLNVSLLN